jgi:hypothetical protein
LPPTPDIKRDRIAIVHGGVMVMMGEVMMEPSDAIPTWFTLVPIEETKEAAASWPRVKHMRILHEMRIGTVDEIIATYREQLTRAFNAMCRKNATGWDQIPELGEASLRKQTEVFERNDVNKNLTNYPFKVDPRVMTNKDARCSALEGYKPRLSVFDRDILIRLLGEWGNKRFINPDDLHYGGLQGPSDDPDAMTKLIDALVIFREDRWRADDIAFARKNGVNRNTICELAKHFVKRHDGKEPKTLHVNEEQYKALGCDGAHTVYLGLAVILSEFGPYLE